MTIVEHHTAARSAGATMLPDARGGRATTPHTVYWMITMHGGERLYAGGIYPPWNRLQTVSVYRLLN